MELNLEEPEPLVLEEPKAQIVESDSQAVAVAPKPKPEVITELDKNARQSALALSSLDPKNPQFSTEVDKLTRLGDSEVRKSAEVSNRMLDRPAVQGKAGSPQAKVGQTLVELRQQVTELDPNRADLTGIRKVFKFLPGGNKVEAYFHRYESAQSQLDAIVRSLRSGQDELRKDNAAIEVERRVMWDTMGKLNEYNDYAAKLDAAILVEIEKAKNEGNMEKANALEADALFAVRQRRTDIQTQMAVAVQGYLALDLVRKNNLELIKGVDRAETTTLAALRTAVIVAQALTQQEIVLNQITGLNLTTSKMIEGTSERLKNQGAAIQKQAAEATVSPDSLRKAFDNVFQTMDAIDENRKQANVALSQTLVALNGQLDRAKPYLDRANGGVDA